MRVFPSARHLSSWARQCPGNDRSAGKQRSGRTRKGSKWLNAALKDAAMSAVRTKNSQAAADSRCSGSAAVSATMTSVAGALAAARAS